MCISLKAILNVLIVTCISLRIFSYQIFKMKPNRTILKNNYLFIFITIFFNYFIVICPIAFSLKYDSNLFRPYRLFLVLPIYFVFTSILNISMLRNRINILGKNNFKAAPFFIDKISDFLTLIAGITPFIIQSFSNSIMQNMLFDLNTEVLLPTLPLAFALNYIKNDIDSQLPSFFSLKEFLYILIPSGVLWLLLLIFLENGKAIFLFIKSHMFITGVFAIIAVIGLFYFSRRLYKTNNKIRCIVGFVLNQISLLFLTLYFLYSIGTEKSNPYKFSWKNINPEKIIILELILLMTSLIVNVKFTKKIVLRWFNSHNNLTKLSNTLKFFIKIMVFSAPYVAQANDYQCMSKLNSFNLMALSSCCIAVSFYFIYLPLYYIDSTYLSDK